MNRNRIAILMGERNLSYAELESLCGVKKPTLQRYATGKTENIPYEAMNKIAAALNVSAAYLAGHSDDPSPQASLLGIVAEDNGLYDGAALLTSAEKGKNTAQASNSLGEYLEMLRNRPECRMLFSVAKDATKDDVEKAVAIIEALRKTEGKN